MQAKYLRVKEAAELLGVSPSLVRLLTDQGVLATARVGRGAGHRRILFPSLREYAESRGRPLPERPEPDPDGSYTVEEAALYLGLSSRFLVDTYLFTGALTLTGREIRELEASIYGEPEEVEEMYGAGYHRHAGFGPGHGLGVGAGHGPGFGAGHGRGYGRGFGPFGWDPEWEARPLSALSLRALKRHLEAARDNIDERLRWVEDELRRRDREERNRDD